MDVKLGLTQHVNECIQGQALKKDENIGITKPRFKISNCIFHYISSYVIYLIKCNN